MEQLLNVGTEIKAKIPNYEKNIMEEKTYIVRRLNTRDVFTFTRIIGKVGSSMISEFALLGQAKQEVVLSDEEKERLTEEEIQAVESQNEEIRAENRARNQQLGLKIIALLPKLEDDAINFLASLIRVTPEEFEELPLEVTLDVVMALIEGDDLKSFFNKTKGLLKIQNKAQ